MIVFILTFSRTHLFCWDTSLAYHAWTWRDKGAKSSRGAWMLVILLLTLIFVKARAWHAAMIAQNLLHWEMLEYAQAVDVSCLFSSPWLALSILSNPEPDCLGLGPPSWAFAKSRMRAIQKGFGSIRLLYRDNQEKSSWRRLCFSDIARTDVRRW